MYVLKVLRSEYTWSVAHWSSKSSWKYNDFSEICTALIVLFPNITRHIYIYIRSHLYNICTYAIKGNSLGFCQPNDYSTALRIRFYYRCVCADNFFSKKNIKTSDRDKFRWPKRFIYFHLNINECLWCNYRYKTYLY